MCLVITKRFTAKKPIFCYKVLYNNGVNLVTPYQRVCMPYNKLYKDPNYESYKDNVRKYTNGWKCVDKGYIHVYNNDPIILRIFAPPSFHVFRAIIPVGSVGFYGKDSEICSNQIIILNPELPGYEELCTEYGIDLSDNKFP